MIALAQLPVLLLALVPLAAGRGVAGDPVAAPAMARGCAPAAPVVVGAPTPAHRYPATRRSAPVWIPGHSVEVTRRVWVPGSTRRVWVPPTWVTRHDAWGRPRPVCVRPGHWRTIHEPGRFETRQERVWVPGRWQHGPR